MNEKELKNNGFQRYYTNTIESKFIKELLRTTYIPTIPIWTPEKTTLAGMSYIADGYIVKRNNVKVQIDANIHESTLEQRKIILQYRYVIDKVIEGIALKDYLMENQIYVRTKDEENETLDIIFFYTNNPNNIYLDEEKIKRLEVKLCESTTTYGIYRGWYYISIPRETPNNFTFYEITQSIKTIYDTNENNEPYFDIIEPYIAGEFYRGLTTNYISNSFLYDSKTHYYLGEYLRFIRDYKKIGLMPYYNCWDGRYSDTLRIITNDNDKVLKTSNNLKDGYKTMIVPIKINTKYTIYIDSSLPVEFASIYYDGVNVLNEKQSDTSSYYKIYDYLHKDYCSFNQPFTYIETEDSTSVNGEATTNINILQNQLVLLIQIPDINTSTVVVLEGDYTNTQLINIDNKLIINDDGTTKLIQKENAICEKYYGKEITELSNEIQEERFKSPSSLVQVIDGNNYAFNNRLIEYLLLNVIDSTEEISNNIYMIQKQISDYTSKNKLGEKYTNSYIKGVWDLKMRDYIFRLITQGKTKHTVDINGFVDKDTERVLGQVDVEINPTFSKKKV